MTDPNVQPAATAQPVVMDQQVINLAKSIRQAESGSASSPDGNFNAAGDYVNGVPTSKGAYQFQAATWKGWAQDVLGDSNAVMSADNQNAVAYGKIKQWKDQGLNPAQIAAKWNSNHEIGWENMIGTNPDTKISYNVPAYVNKVMNNYQTFKAQTPDTSGGGLINTAEASNGQSSQPNQPWTAGGFVENAFSSAGNLIGGLANAAIHPIQTISNVANVAQGTIENTSNLVGGTKFNDATTQMAGNVGTYFKNRYGGDSVSSVLGNIANTAYTDPVGMALDVSTLLDGVGVAIKGVGAISDISRASQISRAVDMIQGAKDLLAGNVTESSAGMVGAMNATKDAGAVSKIGEGLSTAAKYSNPITPVMGVATKTLGMAGKLVGSVASQVIGEPLDTMISIFKNPEEFSKAKMAAMDRGGLANEFGTAVDELASGGGAMSKEYGTIVKSGATADISGAALKEAFAKNGLRVTQEADSAGNLIWKVESPGANTTLSAADASKFEEVLNRFGNGKLTAEQLINAKKYISKNLANYEGRTSDASKLANDVRGVFEQAGDKQIPGLKALDAKMAPQINLWNRIKKEFLSYDTQNKSWVLKDGAANKIANALKKPELLKTMEQVMPGIAQKIEVLKTVESIEASMGIKVGTYTKSFLQGGAMMTGNIPMVIGMIIAHPAVANQILRGFGYVTKATIAPILGQVRAVLGALPEGALMTATKVGVVTNSSQRSTPSKQSQ
jgi:hypothetical protein